MKVDQTIEIELIPEPQGALSNCLHYTNYFFCMFLLFYTCIRKICAYTQEKSHSGGTTIPGEGGGGEEEGTPI